jgi:segregation and condensation protein B
MEDREEDAVEEQGRGTEAEEAGGAEGGAGDRETPEGAPCGEEAKDAAEGESEEASEEAVEGHSESPSEGASEEAEGAQQEDAAGETLEEEMDRTAEAGVNPAAGAQADPTSSEDAELPAEESAEEAARLKALVEALVFAAGGVVTLNALCKVITDHERADVRRALRALIKEYEENERGFYLEEVAGGFEFRTKPQFSDAVRSLLQAAPRRLSRAALETLAMVAYRQPITRGEIEAIRGVDSGGVLSTLMDRRLIKISGRKNAPGRPAVYSTTREFLEVFDLKDLSCLPGLKEIEAPEEEEEYVSEDQEREEPGNPAGEGSEGDSSGGHHVEAQSRDADTGRPGDGERGGGNAGAEG